MFAFTFALAFFIVQQEYFGRPVHDFFARMLLTAAVLTIGSSLIALLVNLMCRRWLAMALSAIPLWSSCWLVWAVIVANMQRI